LGVFGFADDRPANPVVRIFKKTANDSPSPWGEDRDEGGRGHNFCAMASAGLRAKKQTDLT
jgi:hypothetical protein